MNNINYHEYLFAILHHEVFVKDTYITLDDSFGSYQAMYSKYLSSEVSEDYSLSTYDSMINFLEQGV